MPPTGRPARRLIPPIVALGLTQVVGYGTLYYAFGVLAPRLAADLGIGLPFAFGAFSLALLAGAAAAPLAGRAIDRHGARRVMAAGSAGAALALALLSVAQGPVSLVAALIVVEVISAFVLYDAAFAALAQTEGAVRARRGITLMTLIGGFASTVFWPATLVLADELGWSQTYLVFAALHLVVCLPLHLGLPRSRRIEPTGQAVPPPAFAPLAAERHGTAMIWLAIGFALGGAVFSALTAQWVPALGALGLTDAAAVTAGLFLGPAQVAIRIVDLTFGVRRHPLSMAMLASGLLVVALAILLVLPPGLLAASLFATLFGLASGLTSIVRGTVPLALFGAEGFGARLGRLAGLRLATSALAPLGLALVLASAGAVTAFAGALAVAIAALAALTRVPR